MRTSQVSAENTYIPQLKAFENKGSNPLKEAGTDQVNFTDLSVKNKKLENNEKISLVQRYKNLVAATKKKFVTITGYANGTINGVLKGIVLGSITYGAFKAIDLIRNIKPITPKQFPKPVPIIAGAIVGIGALALELYKTNLDVTRKKAGITLRYNPEALGIGEMNK